MSVARFERSNVAGTLQAAAAEGGLLHLKLAGGLGFAFPEIVLRAREGRIHEVLEPNLDVGRSLIWIALAPSGELQRWRDPDPPEGRGIPVLTAVVEAERAAAKVLDHVAALGGLEARLRPDHVRMMAAPDVPDLAARILRLVDGERTLAEVLARSPSSPETAARVLSRTYREGLIERVRGGSSEGGTPSEPGRTGRFTATNPELSPSRPPAEDEASAGLLPSRLEMTGSVVAEDLQRWLSGSDVPDSLLSDDAFSSAFERDRPRSRAAVASLAPEASVAPEAPVAVASPPADSEEDEEAVLVAAGVAGPPRWSWIVGGALLLGILLGLILFPGGPETPPPSAPPFEPLALTATTATVAVATATVSAPPAEPPMRPRTRRRTKKRVAVTVPRLEGTPLERAAALIEAGDAEAAEEILVELRQSAPAKAEVWRLSAQAAVDLGRYREGVARARRAIARAPRRFESWIAKGSALQFDGRITEAIRAYERAVEVDAEHPRVEEVRTVLVELRAESARIASP